MRKRNNRAHSISYLTGGLQAICLRSPTLRCTVLRCIFFIPHWIRSVKLSCTENILTKQKTPRFVMNRGAMLRYKALPECQSICGLFAYCSSCTCTLSRLRRSQLGLQTSGKCDGINQDSALQGTAEYSHPYVWHQKFFKYVSILLSIVFTGMHVGVLPVCTSAFSTVYTPLLLMFAMTLVW